MNNFETSSYAGNLNSGRADRHLCSSADGLQLSSASPAAKLELTGDIFSPLRRSKLRTGGGGAEQRLTVDDLEKKNWV